MCYLVDCLLCGNLILVIFLYWKQNGGQNINGEAQDSVDYAAKTHELQTIIEKQVNFN